MIPLCKDCLHLDMRQAKGGESIRTVGNKRVLMVCMRAVDPLTGRQGEYCSVARTIGYCGPRGLQFEPMTPEDESERPQTTLFAGDPDDFAIDEPDIDLSGGRAAEAEPDLDPSRGAGEPGEEFEDI